MTSKNGSHFTKVAEQSKVVTEGTVNATAVESMNEHSAAKARRGDFTGHHPASERRTTCVAARGVTVTEEGDSKMPKAEFAQTMTYATSKPLTPPKSLRSTQPQAKPVTGDRGISLTPTCNGITAQKRRYRDLWRMQVTFETRSGDPARVGSLGRDGMAYTLSNTDPISDTDLAPVLVAAASDGQSRCCRIHPRSDHFATARSHLAGDFLSTPPVHAADRGPAAKQKSLKNHL